MKIIDFFPRLTHSTICLRVKGYWTGMPHLASTDKLRQPCHKSNSGFGFFRLNRSIVFIDGLNSIEPSHRRSHFFLVLKVL